MNPLTLLLPPSARSASSPMASTSFLTSFTSLLVLFVIGSLDPAPTPSGTVLASMLPLQSPLPLAPKKVISSLPKCSTHVTKGLSTHTLCAPLATKKKSSVKPATKKAATKKPATKKASPQPPAKKTAPPKKAPPKKAPIHSPPKASAPPTVVRRSNGADTLSNDYYATSCPNVEAIIQNKVAEWIKLDRTLAASLLRLHFHDCMATGNDASILLADPIGHSTEMYSVFSKGLRGFEVVDDIKLAVEKACPGIVSCADVLTVIARDVTLQLGGPFWFVPFGRKDSLTSHIADAAQVPKQESNANVLLQQFEAVGLTFADLATLSGAHSVGRAHCFSFTRGGAAGANPRMNATYAKILQKECAPGPWESVFNDPDTPYQLDLQYYTNLKRGMGLFESDESIYHDNALTSSMVDAFLTQPGMWDAQFAVSMVRLGNVNVIAGANQGEIRRVCSVPNTPHRS